MKLSLVSSPGPEGKVHPNAHNFVRDAGDRVHWLRGFNLEMQGPEFELPQPI